MSPTRHRAGKCFAWFRPCFLLCLHFVDRLAIVLSVIGRVRRIRRRQAGLGYLICEDFNFDMAGTFAILIIPFG